MAVDVDTLTLVETNRKPTQALRLNAPAVVALYRRELEQWLQRKAEAAAIKLEEK